MCRGAWVRMFNLSAADDVLATLQEERGGFMASRRSRLRRQVEFVNILGLATRPVASQLGKCRQRSAGGEPIDAEFEGPLRTSPVRTVEVHW